MVKSMTGFGRGSYSDDKRTVTAEIRAVNHRYSEISVKMPRKYAFAEEAVRSMVKSVAPRGKIDVMIGLDEIEAKDTEIRLNSELAVKYAESLKQLSDKLPDIPYDITIRTLSMMPDVISTAPGEEDEEEILNALKQAVGSAAKALDEMRRTEGAKLASDILMRNDLIEQLRQKIAVFAPQVKLNYVSKMRERITELLDGAVQVPEDRILLEAAVFADKADITEELVRLGSHTEHLKSIMAAEDQPTGKKLDFLIQEMNRETNTIGSKCNDIDITECVLALKAEIEKIREQVQNIE